MRKSEGGPIGPPSVSGEIEEKTSPDPDRTGAKWNPGEYRARTAGTLTYCLFALFAFVAIATVAYAMVEPSDGLELIKVALPIVAGPFLIALGVWFGRAM